VCLYHQGPCRKKAVRIAERDADRAGDAMIRIQCGTSVGAFVIPGFSHGGSEAGDCVLLDFKNRFFGVADGSGRSPELSRSLLQRISEKLDALRGFPDTCPGRAAGDCLLSRLAGTIMEEVLGEFYGSGSSTLTGLALCGASDSGCGVLLHTGDSVCIRLDPEEGGMVRLTESNFWMAGKSLKMYTVRPVELGPGCRLVIASDGFMELIERNGPGLERFCASLGDDGRQGTVMEEVYTGGVCRPGHDDAAVVVLCPDMIESFPKKIVMGGTARIETKNTKSDDSYGDDLFREEASDMFFVIN
jgi:hypothetical protein